MTYQLKSTNTVSRRFFSRRAPRTPSYRQINPEFLSSEAMSPLTTKINHLVVLRGHTNQKLHLYTPSNAYARPQELVGTMNELSENLDSWYLDHLPDEKSLVLRPSPLNAAWMMGSSQVSYIPAFGRIISHNVPTEGCCCQVLC